jgi:hypothetical protein
VNGKLATTKQQYQPLGDLWKTVGKAYGLDVAWGGDFPKLVDSPHFSCVWREGSEVIK